MSTPGVREKPIASVPSTVTSKVCATSTKQVAAALSGAQLAPLRLEIDGRAVPLDCQVDVEKLEGSAYPSLTSEISTFSVPVPPGAHTVALTLTIPGVQAETFERGGWNSFSGVRTRDHAVGTQAAGETPWHRTFFVEPPAEPGNAAASQGRSYGYLGIHDKKGQEQLLGLLPRFHGVDEIRYRQVGPNLEVTLCRHFDGAARSDAYSHFRLLRAQGPLDQGLKLLGSELRSAARSTGVKPLHKMVAWFSWASHGKKVTQADVERELRVGKGIINAAFIDDGWQTCAGDWKVDRTKFPDMRSITRLAEENGIVPGIWVAPFMSSVQSDLYKQHPDWFIRDAQGKLAKVANPQVQPTPKTFPLIERPVGLDISKPEVREHLFGVFEDLAEQGFRAFKVDFLAIPFMSSLANKDKTPVEYYRDFFLELRKRLEAKGHPSTFIGCGAPLIESLGLFEGIRISPDSAMPNPEGMNGVGGLVGTLKKLPLLGPLVTRYIEKVNTTMYQDALEVASRRVAPFGEAMGFFLDGLHLADESVNLNIEERDRLNQLAPELSRKSEHFNVFVGDSLHRIGERNRGRWREFLANVFPS